MPLPKLEGFKGSNRTMVFGIEGVSWVVEQQQTATYILECTESQITVPHRTNKVSVDKCKHVSVKIEQSPLTSSLEIYNSENVDIFLSDICSIHTITLDNCDEIKIHVSDTRDQLSKVWWHKVSKVYVNHVGGAGLILLDKIEECNRITMFQHVCTVKEDGTFTKEPIMRDADTGFPMTEAEKVHSDDQRRIGQENTYKMIKGSIVVEKKK